MTSNTEPVIVRNDGIMGGRPIFRGTRVQADILFENLAEGYSLDDIIQNFPTLDRDDLQAALHQACELLKRSAPKLDPLGRDQEPLHARVLR